MERVKIAGVLYRLVREQATKSPRVVTAALIASNTWGVRADFDDGHRDYRYHEDAPIEEVRGGFDSWPPLPVVSGEEAGTVHEIRLRDSASK